MFRLKSVYTAREFLKFVAEARPPFTPESPPNTSAASAVRTRTLSIRRFRSTTHHGSVSLSLGSEASEYRGHRRRWWPDKSSEAAGQVFEPDRPPKSLHLGGWCPKTKPLVTDLKAPRASDMPSKSVCGRKPAGGFDSRSPPLSKLRSDQRLCARIGATM